MENMIQTIWNRNKIIFKGLLIGFLVLLLLLPTVFIETLISERQDRQREATAEVSAKWAGNQTITGPVIAVPYFETAADVNGKDVNVKKLAFFLPDKLSVRASIVPEKRYRGIYQVIVYTTELQINGSYDSLHFAEMNIPADKMLWTEAVVYFDISDVKGLSEEVKLKIGDANLDLVPGKFSNEQFKNALCSLIPGDAAIDHHGLNFSMSVKLKGSENLLFIPTGKQTNVFVQSSWSHPSFTGGYLPDVRNVNDSGFVASWKVLYLNRNYPQQWKDKTYDLETSAFGVNLIVPVDVYQQTTRSVEVCNTLHCELTFYCIFSSSMSLFIPKPFIHYNTFLLVFALCIFLYAVTFFL